MKFTASLLPLAFIVGTAAPLRADQADDAIVAAMKLSSAVNYSWKTTVNQNSHASEINGKTSTAGYSLLTFIGYAGGPSGGSGTNAVFMGDSKYVVETSSGSWLSPGGVSAASNDGAGNNRSNGSGRSPLALTRRRTRTRGNRGSSGGLGGGGQRGRSGDGSSGTDSNAPASTTPRLPTGISLPHEDLAIIAANYTDMHFADGVVSGKLTEFGVAAIRRRRMVRLARSSSGSRTAP